MHHYLTLVCDDVKLNIDDGWPTSFLNKHGELFDCEISIDFVVNILNEMVGTPLGLDRYKNAEIKRIEDISIKVNDRLIPRDIEKLMAAKIKGRLTKNPTVLIDYAVKELLS